MLNLDNHFVTFATSDHSILHHSVSGYISDGRGFLTTYGPRVMDKAHFPQSAPLTWIEYGKSGVNMKDTPQRRVSVPGKGPQGQRQAEGRELRHGR